MNRSRVAVVIPAFNAASTIGETLDALQRNSALSNIARVVLLDDCSDDGTIEVAERHWRSDVAFEVWRNPTNMGERRTTNAGIGRLADCVDWTLVLHADDVVKPDWLSLYLEAISVVPASVASICSSYDYWWPETGRIQAGEEFPGLPAVHIRGEMAGVIGTLDRGCWWHLSGCGLRNTAFSEIGGFTPDMPQLGDWEWLLRCLSKGFDIWYLPRTTMLYRQHSASISSNAFRSAIDVRERLRIFRLVAAGGFITKDGHRARVRLSITQLVRRALGRIARGDGFGFCKHVSLIVESLSLCLRGRL